MADIEIERQHNMDLATARHQAKQWLKQACDEYGLDVDYVAKIPPASAVVALLVMRY